MIKISDLRIGMKLKVRNDLEPYIHYGVNTFADEMKKYNIVTVQKFDTTNQFKIKEDNEMWFWTPEMIEEIVEEDMKQIEEYPNGTLFYMADGSWNMKIDKTLYDLTSNNTLTMNSWEYNSDLTCSIDKNANILKIAEATITNVFDALKDKQSIESTYDLVIIWERKSKQVEELETVINDLEKDLKLAKERLNNIKGGNQ